MSDDQELEALREWVARFAAERGWDELRTLKDLSAAIGIEASELQEIFLWVGRAEEDGIVENRRPEIESELADVLIYLLAFAERIGIDVVKAGAWKMELNEGRFPPPDGD